MALTKGDEYPIHQTAEPVMYSGTDRNFYDRFFFNGYHATEGELFFGAAMGVYPHLNVTDAAFSVVRDGVETSVFAGAWLKDRMDMAVGPIRVEVLEPLNKVRLTVNAPDKGLRAELTFTGRTAPIEEPRFTRRIGPRIMMDLTRMTQNGRWEGWIELDGKREDVAGFVGTRDRSWGVRPIGARDAQTPVPPAPQQFYWLWSPCNFGDGSIFFHVNDDEHGRPWNLRGVWAGDNASSEEAMTHFHAARADIQWQSGKRHAARAVVTLTDEDGRQGTLSFEPLYEFLMLGIGYGHPTWGHGQEHGELTVERVDLKLADADPRQPHHLHVQALSKVTWRDADGRERVGRGVLEQLVIGPHAPSGFKGLLDMAA